jgi:hypothetical protein
VYDSDIKEIPEFILHSSKIYTFIDLKHYTEFSKMFVEESPPSVSFFKTFLNNPQTRNYAIELINKYLRDYFYRKGIGYNKDYNRFFFKNFNKEPLSSETKPNFIKEVYRVENYLSKKRTKTETEREVVTSYKYYDNTEFYRHLAFEVYYFLDNDNLNISITPKYLFTSNGKEVLSDKKKITRYTNYLTSREFNQQVLNHIYFIYQYLSENKETIQITNFENCTLSLSKMVIIKVPFSIDFCNKSEKKELDENIIQQRLFD